MLKFHRKALNSFDMVDIIPNKAYILFTMDVYSMADKQNGNTGHSQFTGLIIVIAIGFLFSFFLVTFRPWRSLLLKTFYGICGVDSV